MDEQTATARLELLVGHFAAAPTAVQTQALADYAARLPDAVSNDDLELVSGCRPPMAIGIAVSDNTVRLRFQVTPEPALLRGFAGMVYDALDGAAVGEVASLGPEVVEPLLETLDVPAARCVEAVVTHLAERAARIGTGGR